jgi:hypothetical protein
MAQKPARRTQHNPQDAAFYVLVAIKRCAGDVYADLMQQADSRAAVTDWATRHGIDSVEIRNQAYVWLHKKHAPHETTWFTVPRPTPAEVELANQRAAWELKRRVLFPPNPETTTLRQWIDSARQIYREAERFGPRKKQGAPEKLEKHCEWFVRFHLCRESQANIARADGVERPAVTMAITKVSDLLSTAK